MLWTVCWRHKGADAFPGEGCSCSLRGIMGSKPGRMDYFPNSSIYPHQHLRSFQNPGSSESIKSMRLLVANINYSGRHFFPRTESLCPPSRAASPNIRMSGSQWWMNTDAEQRAHRCWRDHRKGMAVPPLSLIQPPRSGVSPLHTLARHCGVNIPWVFIVGSPSWTFPLCLSPTFT